MYLIPIAWLYVALMMAVAEATNTNGTVLGGLITFLLYGVGPVLLVLYLMGFPSRRRALKVKEHAERQAYLAQAAAMPNTAEDCLNPSSSQPNASGHAPADAVASVRKEP